MPATLEQLRSEFDKWAKEGRGESMEEGHRAVAGIILDMMDLRPDSRILDLGCGTGWATRLLAARAPNGHAIGLDISEEMIRHARDHGDNPPNVNFRVLAGDRFPFHDGVFTHCLSIESLYYHPDIRATLREVHRVLAPGGRAFLMVNFFKENPYTHHWTKLLDVPVHLLSGEEYCALGQAAGFRCRYQMVPDPTPVPAGYCGRHYGTPENMRASRAIGALLVVAEKD